MKYRSFVPVLLYICLCSKAPLAACSYGGLFRAKPSLAAPALSVYHFSFVCATVSCFSSSVCATCGMDVCAKNQHKNRDKNQPCHSMAMKEGSKQATLLREPEQAANRAPLWRAGYRANKAVFLLRRLLPSYGPGDIAWARTISGTRCCASLQQPKRIGQGSTSHTDCRAVFCGT